MCLCRFDTTHCSISLDANTTFGLQSKILNPSKTRFLLELFGLFVLSTDQLTVSKSTFKLKGSFVVINRRQWNHTALLYDSLNASLSLDHQLSRCFSSQHYVPKSITCCSFCTIVINSVIIDNALIAFFNAN